MWNPTVYDWVFSTRRIDTAVSRPDQREPIITLAESRHENDDASVLVRGNVPSLAPCMAAVAILEDARRVASATIRVLMGKRN